MREDILSELGHRDPQIRVKAIQALSLDDDPDALACLINCLSDEAVPVRRAARTALKRLTGLDFGYDREHWNGWWKQKATLRCSRCSRRLFASRLYYLARLTLTSEPRELILTEEDLARPNPRDLQSIAEELSKRDPDEVRDEVYVRLRYYLCTPCKLAFVQEARRNGAEDEE